MNPVQRNHLHGLSLSLQRQPKAQQRADRIPVGTQVRGDHDRLGGGDALADEGVDVLHRFAPYFFPSDSLRIWASSCSMWSAFSGVGSQWKRRMGKERRSMRLASSRRM